MPTLTYQSGGRVNLGKELGSGGEGSVFSLNDRDDDVVKVYAKPPSSQQVEKLQAMIARGTPEIRKYTTWPIALVFNGARVAGYTMPRLAYLQPIHGLFGPKERNQVAPEANWAYLVHLCKNLSAAFEMLHSHDLVIGDVNSTNIIAEPKALVRFIDCDSFQVRAGGQIYYCEVGVGEYQPREAQGVDLSRIVRRPSQDVFGLATIIFQLLFIGRHPFAGRLPPHIKGGGAIADNIAAGRYFYSATAQSQGLLPPMNSANVGIVLPQMRTMFERAFLGKPDERPSAAQWHAALGELERNVEVCSANPAHRHLRAQACVWCALEAATGLSFFIVPIPVGKEGALNDSIWQTFTNDDAKSLWAQIAAITAPPTTNATPPKIKNLAAKPLPPETVQRGHIVLATFLAAWLASIPILVYASGGVAFIVIVLGSLVAYTLRPDVRVETTRRRHAATSARAVFNDVSSALDAVNTNRRFAETKRKLEETKNMVLEQRAKYDAEIRKMEQDREADERKAFLDSFTIADAKIKGFGAKRKASLLSFGIETALDIDYYAIQLIPGMGQSRAYDLLAWRQGIERRFRFDPKRGLDPKRVRDVANRYVSARIAARQALLNGATALRMIVAETERERPRAFQHAEEASRMLAEALINLKAVERPYYRTK